MNASAEIRGYEQISLLYIFAPRKPVR